MLVDKPVRNLLFLAIQKDGFDPAADFELEHNETQWKLQHRSWGDWFAIHESPRGLMVSYQVGDAKPISAGLGRPETAPPVLGRWLQDIKINHETPDLWEELGRDRMSALAEGQENTPFTPQEQAEIARLLAEIKRDAHESYALETEELKRLEAGIDYLVDAATRVGRRDWLLIAYSVLAGKFADAVLHPEVAEKVMQAIGVGLGALFGHPPPMLGP